MTTTLDIEQVDAFATAVRRELLDLGPDTLDELTDGLEADLADKLADGEPLGDPAAYAAELRAASGLSPAALPSAMDNVRANLAHVRSRVAPFLAHPVAAETIAFFVALRPVWWVLRAWGLFYIFTGFNAFPGNQFDPMLGVALLLLSIQWGRGHWLPWKWSRGAVVALSVIAVLTLPSIASAVEGRVTFADRMDPNDYVSDGILLDKQQVTNIFAYGADGELLTGVRLYDQDGDPLSVMSDQFGDQAYWGSPDGEFALVPSEQAGTEGWNVYPLAHVDYADLSDDGTVPSWAKREVPTPPFASVQQLLGYEPPAPNQE
jgi:hypothetical protein